MILDQPEPLTELAALDDRVTSAIIEVECLHGIEAACARGWLAADEVAERRGATYVLLRRLRRVAPSRGILRRAGESYPTPVKTLDAVHLATALTLLDRGASTLAFATYDRQLARAAAAVGLTVLGA